MKKFGNSFHMVYVSVLLSVLYLCTMHCHLCICKSNMFFVLGVDYLTYSAFVLLTEEEV
jgi:hypothetical protein